VAQRIADEAGDQRDVVAGGRSVGDEDDLVAAGCHNHGERAGSLHLVGALPSGRWLVGKPKLSLPKGDVSGCVPIRSNDTVNDWS